MRPHIERRLEVLAKEIAAKNAPRLNPAENALFQQIAKSHAGKTGSDWNSKDGTKRALIEDTGAARPLPAAASPAKFNAGDRVINKNARENGVGVVLRITSAPYGGGLAAWVKREDDKEKWASLGDLELAQPVAQGDGWIGWSGGKCPVPAGTLIDTRHRIDYCGDKECYSVKALDENGAAHANVWSNDDHKADIVAYRVVSQ